MPQVPELTSPSVEPGPPADITQHIAGISPDAFGAGIGQALEQTGQVGAKQAMAWQDLHNEANASDLFVKGVTAIGQQDAQFGLLQGKAAADGLPGHVAAIQSIREDIIGQADNPAVARMVTQQIQRQVGYSIINASTHAAQQTKTYYQQSLKSSLELASQDAATASTHDAFASAMSDVEGKVGDLMKSSGISQDDPTYKLTLQKYTDQAITSRIGLVAEQNPAQAKALLEQFKHSDKYQLGGLAYNKAAETVDRALMTVQSHVVGDSVLIGGPTIDQASKENYAMASLTNTTGHIGAAAVVGGLVRESGLKETALNPGDGSDGSDSIGVAQWNGKRAADLKNWAATNHLDYHDYKAQVQFVNYELQTKYPDLAQKLRTMTDPADIPAAAEMVNRIFEGSADSNNPRASDRQRQGFEARVLNAQRLAMSQPSVNGVNPMAGPGQEAALVDQTKAKAADAAKGYWPDSPAKQQMFVDASVNYAQSKYRASMQVQRDQDAGNLDTVYAAMGSGKFGDSQSFVADPQVKQALDSLRSSGQNHKANLLEHQFAQSLIVHHTEEGDSRFNELMGQADNDPKEFLGVKPEEENLLTTSQLSQLNKRQRAINAGAVAEPDMGKVLKEVRGANLLEGMDETFKDPAERNKFTGALRGLIMSYKDENKKPPGMDDPGGLRDMVAGLLKQQVTGPGMLWGSKTDTTYRGYSLDLTEAVTKQWDEKFGFLNRKPTPQEFDRMATNLRRQRITKDALDAQKSGEIP